MADEDAYAPSPWDWVRNQVEEYERTGAGSITLNGQQYPIIVVHNKGAQTGALRKTPLMRVEHNGEWALIGSIGGRPTNPVWVYNLRKYPDAVAVQDGPTVVPVTIRELEGDERLEWFAHGVAAYPPYAEYQARTERVIPVFRATPKS